ncbi:lasso RiPP family leader peptide-containing protein [Nakamurella sp. GG22]
MDDTTEVPVTGALEYDAPTFTRLGTLAELTLGLNVGGTDDGFLGWNSDGPGSI